MITFAYNFKQSFKPKNNDPSFFTSVSDSQGKANGTFSTYFGGTHHRDLNHVDPGMAAGRVIAAGGGALQYILATEGEGAIDKALAEAAQARAAQAKIEVARAAQEGTEAADS